MRKFHLQALAKKPNHANNFINDDAVAVGDGMKTFCCLLQSLQNCCHHPGPTDCKSVASPHATDCGQDGCLSPRSQRTMSARIAPRYAFLGIGQLQSDS